MIERGGCERRILLLNPIKILMIMFRLNGADVGLCKSTKHRMEMHRLSNPDPSLRFALLSDHIDAPAAHMPVDIEVEEELVSGIRRLNVLYGQGGDGPFHLLHRSRRFNPAEDCWMGWERKRGKLGAARNGDVLRRVAVAQLRGDERTKRTCFDGG